MFPSAIAIDLCNVHAEGFLGVQSGKLTPFFDGTDICRWTAKGMIDAGRGLVTSFISGL
jgi:hypothetical protein